MKRFMALLTAAFLCIPLCAGNAEGAENTAVFGGNPEMAETAAGDQADGAAQKPFIPEGVEKKIIDSDDRYSADVRQYPFCAVAYIEVRGTCGCSWTGTGFMVGPSGMMTAGHVMQCKEHGNDAAALTFYFGYQSERNYVLKYEKGATYWYNFTRNSGSEEYDYAYIKLQERVGDSVGWFGMNALPDTELDGMPFYAAGYRFGELKADYDWVHVVTPYQVSHTIDTEPGYSGCPIYDSHYYAVAINTAHSDVFPENYGCRITGRMINDMRSKGLFD